MGGRGMLRSEQGVGLPVPDRDDRPDQHFESVRIALSAQLPLRSTEHPWAPGSGPKAIGWLPRQWVST